jgi:hypothetical protein
MKLEEPDGHISLEDITLGPADILIGPDQTWSGLETRKYI